MRKEYSITFYGAARPLQRRESNRSSQICVIGDITFRVVILLPVGGLGSDIPRLSNLYHSSTSYTRSPATSSHTLEAFLFSSPFMFVCTCCKHIHVSPSLLCRSAWKLCFMRISTFACMLLALNLLSQEQGMPKISIINCTSAWRFLNLG